MWGSGDALAVISRGALLPVCCAECREVREKRLCASRVTMCCDVNRLHPYNLKKRDKRGWIPAHLLVTSALAPWAAARHDRGARGPRAAPAGAGAF